MNKLHNDLKFLKDEHIRLNAILVYKNIRKSTFQIISKKIYNKFQKIISKYPILQLYDMTKFYADRIDNMNYTKKMKQSGKSYWKKRVAFLLYNKKHKKEVLKLDKISTKDGLPHNIVGELLGFGCPNDFRKKKESMV